MNDYKIHCGDALAVLKGMPDESVQCCVTSPPYFQQCDYKSAGQLGLEPYLREYLTALGDVFEEVKRTVVDRGCLWIIIGDTYNNFSYVRSGSGDRKKGLSHSRRRLTSSHREKEPLTVPFDLIYELRCRGWIHRSVNIWDKGVVGQPAHSDRPILSHEYILQFVKYEGSGRPYANCRPLADSVFYAPPESIDGHPCPFPVRLVEPLILASSNEGDTVLDPFTGSGSTAVAAFKNKRNFVGSELNPEYIKIAEKRLSAVQVRFNFGPAEGNGKAGNVPNPPDLADTQQDHPTDHIYEYGQTYEEIMEDGKEGRSR